MKKQIARFRKLCEAALDHQLCLAHCTDVRTGKPAHVICIINQEDGVTNYVPVARVFDGDPSNDVSSPGVRPPMMI